MVETRSILSSLPRTHAFLSRPLVAVSRSRPRRRAGGRVYRLRPNGRRYRPARGGALRFADYCSASFVSPRGLILTNHHCARKSVADVSREGETLIRDGFYAERRSAERRVKDLYVEQVVEVRDVTDSLRALVAGAPVEDNDIETIAKARRRQVAQFEERLTRRAERQDTTLRVRVVPLYDGARYSAYTVKRYHDVRLVMAPERDLGYYGGAADNFTYPRYTLDVAFFRAYTPEGEPVRDNVYFPFSRAGASEGDAVFAVGTPGTTSRLSTASQLAYQRDVARPQRLETLEARVSILEPFIEKNPDTAAKYDLGNTLFSLQNALEAARGELDGLRDPYLLARRRAAQQATLDSLTGRDSLQSRYREALRRTEQVQSAKRSGARQAGAFTGFLNPRLGSHLLARAFYGYYYATLQRRRDAPADELERIRLQGLRVENRPPGLEKKYIAARLRQLRDQLGPSDPTTQRTLGGQSPRAVAERLVQESALVDSTGFAKVLEAGYLGSGDPSVEIIRPIASLFLQVNRQQRDFTLSEEALAVRRARARLSLSEARERLAPDATATLRLSDGRVKGYAYNGTRAPPYTTFYGLYDHYASYQRAPAPDNEAWSLPEQWQTPPEAFQRATPLNLVSTNDIAGGNSGSPLLNRNLELVGVVFDSNTQAFPNTFLYRKRAARAISVDPRGIVEALEDLYEADRLVSEITGSMRGPGQAGAEAASEAEEQ
ncbi:MAG: S46 family peptidase [Bacteroidetes bacterium QS_9_68_14]|nr:MAG: S46 family peptidase [Bacteroidetes bacterium QS_9_68_14]